MSGKYKGGPDWIQEIMPETPETETNQRHRWHESQLFALILGSLLTLVGTLVATSFNSWYQKYLDNRQVSESLKVAFRGEISSIRSVLTVEARTAMKAWEEGGTLKEYRIAYPRTIYEAHARNLGDLRESVLVGHISNLYSTRGVRHLQL